jgi:hypothetical protein
MTMDADSQMQQSLTAMNLALRVLSAFTERRQADPQDLATLRELAPDAADMPADELACEVIQRAIRHRAEVRSQTA